MVSVDGSVFVQVLNFLLLIWILNMVLYKPIRKVLTKRSQKIYELESEVNVCSRTATDKDYAYVTGIKNARLNGKKQKEAILDIAADEQNKIIGKINDDAKAELEEIKGRIRSEINTVRMSLENDVEIFAKAIGHKILGRTV